MCRMMSFSCSPFLAAFSTLFTSVRRTSYSYTRLYNSKFLTRHSYIQVHKPTIRRMIMSQSFKTHETKNRASNSSHRIIILKLLYVLSIGNSIADGFIRYTRT
ncbi:hypothetical protein F4810DRAFT_670435 [Camillea tinctor]|nr:hypothetical protein F4810DRAFT_670435 [Camillea tinctor]